MANTLDNVQLPARTWVDLYSATGIPVGVVIAVQNIGPLDVRLSVKPTTPAVTSKAYNILQRANGLHYRNTAGDQGAWAFCLDRGEVNVRMVE